MISDRWWDMQWPAALLVSEAALAREGDLVMEEVDWSERPLVELVDYLVDTYHQPLLAGVAQLQTLLQKAAREEHGADAAVIQAIHDEVQTLASDLEQHLAKEERLFSPVIREGRFISDGPELQSLLDEHGSQRSRFERIRGLVESTPVPAHASESWRLAWGGLRNLDEGMAEHMALEESQLFPRILE